ncbi:hypothetical protein B0H34DRAFT_366816 [Crassisporium funariophilum]|nr:hypothetical protein B0H34DRAFT_366816 [Crassisporium funariophilum]
MQFANIALVVAIVATVNAYVPALPTNSTRDAIAGGLNITDISKLNLQWYSNGSYSEHVSYQLVGNGSLGLSKGVLVHFSEEKASNLTAPTTTPWIALVSCDQNATDASQEEDVFTLARDKGAVSALLYSLYSAACVINPEYSDPSTFDQVFDIFSTQSLTSAHLIEYQFGQLGSSNKSLYAYDSQQLNNSASDIWRSMNVSYPVSQGYLLASLQAYNATDVGGDNSSTPGGNTGSTNTTSPGSPNTALAMIILYAITGCVSALFCIVIISGAIRAIRHPERYGPRARMGDNGGPQSRARGITRAILDTFPIVKFGSTLPTTASEAPREKDPENQIPHSNFEMRNIDSPSSNNLAYESVHLTPGNAEGKNEATDGNAVDGAVNLGSTERPRRASQPGSPGSSRSSPENQNQSHDVGEGSSRDITPATDRVGQDDVVPASIGRETCPICIVDFEEGDDIRLLPCEGKHCFHQACVDPWLLKLSSSCPICRHDFLALENMLSGHPDDEVDEADNRLSVSRTQGPHGNNGGRFSRYLRFAHRRQHRTRRAEETDPTDPYMPTAPETTMYSGI